MEALRLAWRLQRIEIAFVAAVCLALAAAAVALTLDLQARYELCAATVAGCEPIWTFQEGHTENVGTLGVLIGFVPFAAGLVLGVPLVAREIEGRTALVAWPLGRSRVRWLVLRTVPVAVIGLLLVALLAVVSDRLLHAFHPTVDVGFIEYHTRGVPLVLRFLVVFGAAVALGTILGRLLPALLVGIAVAVAVWTALLLALPHWAPSVELEEDFETYEMGALSTGVGYRMPDGRLISIEEGGPIIEAAYAEAGSAEPDPATLPRDVRFGIAAERYFEVLIRETAALAGVLFVLAAGAAVAVHRRRADP